MGSDMLSLFSLIIGVYLIYAAIVGRGKLYLSLIHISEPPRRS